MMGSRIWKHTFWVALAERSVSTAAQAAILALGAGQLNALDADWKTVGGFALGGGILAALKGLAVNASTQDGPGLTLAERVNH